MSDFIRDGEGNLLNPPVLPEYEQRITAAQNAGDDGELARLHDEYHDAREEYVRDVERREQNNDGDPSPQEVADATQRQTQAPQERDVTVADSQRPDTTPQAGDDGTPGGQSSGDSSPARNDSNGDVDR